VLGDGGIHRARGTFDPLNGLLGALAYAGTATIALGVVDDSHVVLEEDGLIRGSCARTGRRQCSRPCRSC